MTTFDDVRRRFRRPIVAGICVALAVAQPASAHPHVWVTVRCDLILDDQRNLVGLVERWTYDDMFSAYAVTGLDRNGDGRYEREELRELTETVTRNAAGQDFFTEVEAAGAQVELRTAWDQSLEVSPTGSLTFQIRVEFVRPVRLGEKPVRIAVYDKDLYADFRFAKTDFARFHPQAAQCSARIDEPDTHALDGYTSLEDKLIRGPILPLTNAILVTC